MNVGQRIKMRRLELQLTQRELASKVGYSDHSTLARIEAGKVDLSQTKVAEFAEALNTTIPYLMGWEDIEERAMLDAKMAKDKELRETIKKYIALPEDKKRTISTMIEDYFKAFANG